MSKTSAVLTGPYMYGLGAGTTTIYSTYIFNVSNKSAFLKSFRYALKRLCAKCQSKVVCFLFFLPFPPSP